MDYIGDLDPKAFDAWMRASAEAEWQLTVLWQQARIPPHEVLVIVVDLRSQTGRDIIVGVYGQHHVEQRLSEAARAGIPPAAAAVLELDDGGRELVAMYWSQLLAELDARPLGTTPVLLLDRDAKPTMTWASCHLLSPE